MPLPRGQDTARNGPAAGLPGFLARFQATRSEALYKSGEEEKSAQASRGSSRTLAITVPGPMTSIRSAIRLRKRKNDQNTACFTQRPATSRAQLMQGELRRNERGRVVKKK